MSSLGPAWFCKELPYPIARAIHLAEQDEEPEKDVLAGCVEIALRVIAAFHIADLRAQGKDLPAILKSGFLKPSLGSWIAAVKFLSEANTKPTFASLRGASSKDAQDSLRTIVEARNALSHGDERLLPWSRDARYTQLLEATKAFLLELSWMRGLRMVQLDTASPPVGPRKGQLRAWVGLISDMPAPEQAVWEGDAPTHRLVLIEREADGECRTLDLHPLLFHGPLGADARHELRLFSGIGERGDLNFQSTAPGANARGEFVMMGRPSAVGRLVFLGGRSPQSVATMPAVGSGVVRVARPRGTAPLIRSGPDRDAARPRKPSRWRTGAWALGGLLIAGGAVAAIAMLAQPKRGTPLDAAEAAAIIADLPGPAPTTAAFPGDGAPARRPEAAGGAQRAGAPTRSPRDEVEALARAMAPPDPSCPAPPLLGAWRFKTTVLGAHADRPRAIGINGYYALEMRGQHGCHLAADFAKTGFSGSKRDHVVDFQARPSFRIAPSGATVDGLVSLFASTNDTLGTDIGFRFAAQGRYLVGLWRYENAAREKAGFWGALVGQREGESEPANVRCFNTCIEQCHGDRPASDLRTEACLLSCAPKVDGCD